MLSLSLLPSVFEGLFFLKVARLRVYRRAGNRAFPTLRVVAAF
jgi:hypothetical protein